MEEKRINKKITISIVAILMVVLITIGATYAYFSATATTDVQTVTTGTLSMGFTNGDILRATGLTPISDSEIKTKAMELPFTITNTGSEHNKITIELTDITMSEELKDVDFRWGLYNADTDKGVSFGTFSNIGTSTSITLLQDVIIDAGASAKNYVLRVWIHDDGALQNYMQSKSLSAKVTVTGEAVQYTPESCFLTDGDLIYGYGVEVDEEGNIVYENGVAKTNGKCPTDVVIPKTIKGVTVTQIGVDTYSYERFDDYDASSSWGTVTSLILPDSIAHIAVDEFSMFPDISILTLPESVTRIHGNAFAESDIGRLIIPEGVTFDYNAFSWTNITSIVLPGDSQFQFYAFDDVNLSDVVLMDGIDLIGSFTFANNNLTTIEIPNSVNTIYQYAFANNPNLTEIIVRGKTEAPEGFQENWNCISDDYDEEEGTCTKYANVIYRP